MKSDLPIEIQRFKQVREEHNFTQTEFAEVLNIKNSTSDIERGRTKLSGQVVMQLLKIFEINPLWIFGESFQKKLDVHHINSMPKVISISEDNNRENMLLVNQKAAAGYPQNIGDAEFYQQLPAFEMPIPQFRNASFRGFQIEGDSMEPNFRADDWVLGKSVESLQQANNHKVYVFVLQDSVLVKKLHKHPNSHKVSLISTNSYYPPYEIEASEIQEIWEVTSKLTFSINENSENSMLKKLEQSMEDLKAQLHSIKKV
ncbi:XRE family transcriptional regulator [Psychroflexus aestuariivivens]|uniref:XRE family transcriptional regulator n=1 Tax=Psychroflexus aestuariivivens TaxID=1795040 RepID=UPI000FDC6B0F|nr:LexA family transcriptional regulator [Psychroflexus aestuariivivens]